MLGPGMNIARIATNGRNFEYFGEDPFLAGKSTSAAIRGIQSQHVLAQGKHYAANNQETDRNTIDARVDERTLREIYLPAFERSIKEGGLASVMCAYNKVNGPYACENKELLDGYLRRDWGFTGFVTSDWGATHSTVDSALAGLDMEMFVAPPHYYGDPLKQAVTEGKVPMSRLDGMLRHIFVPMFRFGLFDNPPVSQPQAYTSQVDTPEHRALARRMAEEATVLLKNDGNLLPLDHGTGRTIAVIGYAANPGRAQTGIDSGRIVALSEDTMKHLKDGKPVYDKSGHVLALVRGDKGRLQHVMRLDRAGGQAVVASNAATLAVTAALSQQLEHIEQQLTEIRQTLDGLVADVDRGRLATPSPRTRSCRRSLTACEDAARSPMPTGISWHRSVFRLLPIVRRPKRSSRRSPLVSTKA